jgi:hypothetical protein
MHASSSSIKEVFVTKMIIDYDCWQIHLLAESVLPLYYCNLKPLYFQYMERYMVDKQYNQLENVCSGIWHHVGLL